MISKPFLFPQLWDSSDNQYIELGHSSVRIKRRKLAVGVPINSKLSFDDSVRLLEKNLSCSVEAIARTGRCAVSLSGGIDSAVVASALNSFDDFLPVSMIFNGDSLQSCNDKELVMILCEKLQKKPLFINGDLLCYLPLKFDNQISKYELQGPSTVSNPHYTQLIGHILDELKIANLLTGEGADYIALGEYVIYDSLISRGKIRTAINQFSKLRPYTKNLNFKHAVELLVLAQLPYFNTQLYNKYLNHDMPLSPSISYTALPVVDKDMPKNPYKDWVRRYHFDQLWPQASYISELPETYSTISPFLTKSVIEAIFSMPPEHHFDIDKHIQGNDYFAYKQVIRSLYGEIVPKEISQKQKKVTYNNMAKEQVLNSSADILELFSQKDQNSLSDLGICNDKVLFQYSLSLMKVCQERSTELTETYQEWRRLIALKSWLKVTGSARDALDNYVLFPRRPGNIDTYIDGEIC